MRKYFTHILFFITINTSLNLDVECDVGYYGQNCDFRCRYPNYGKLCQKMCDCSKMKCDYVYGCGNMFGINFIHIYIKIKNENLSKKIDAFKTGN